MKALWQVADLLEEGPLPERERQQIPQCSRAFFCSFCGQTWARVELEGTHWQFHARTCPQCAPRASRVEVAGSLYLPLQWRWNDAMPLGVAVREVLLHVDHYAKGGML